MAGIKISNLPAASTPLAGSETIAIVQSTCTKSTPISAIADIVSSSFVTSSQYASTSGAWTTVNSTSANWSSVYSSYQSTSASFARKDACNCFVCPQIFTSVINASTITAGYSATANGACSSVLGGYYNDANGNGSVVVAGNNNDTWGNFSSIAGGENHCITGDGGNGFIGGGTSNRLNGPGSAVIAGNNNNTSACCSTIAGGEHNCIEYSGIKGFIGGGTSNYLMHSDAAIFGTCIQSVSGDMLHVNRLYVGNLPSTNPGVPGVIWSNAGTLSVS